MITARNATTVALMTIDQVIIAIQREINENPPIQSKANEVRRAELDQLRDMQDRRR